MTFFSPTIVVLENFEVRSRLTTRGLLFFVFKSRTTPLQNKNIQALRSHLTVTECSAQYEVEYDVP